MNLYYSLALMLDIRCVGEVGDYEVVTPVIMESLLKYHPLVIWNLTPYGRHRLVGSLTGVVASKRVTEASQGALSTNGNRA